MPRRRAACYALGIIIFLSVPETKLVAFGDKQEAAAFSVAGGGYIANRDSFTHFSCRFKIKNGKAQSLKEALKGILSDEVITEVRWLVDGENVKYELTGEDRLLAAAKEAGRKALKPGKAVISLPFLPYVLLTNGKYRFRYTPPIEGANIGRPGIAAVPGIDITPFGLGIMGRDDCLNPGRILHDCAAGAVPCRYEGTKVIDGSEVVAYSRGGPEDYCFTYFMDPLRGFQPIQIWGKAGRSKVLDYKAFYWYEECDSGRWFPKRGVVIDNPEAKGSFFHVREVVVTELEAKRRPRRSEFSLTIPAGTQVSDPSLEPGFFNVSVATEVRLDTLKSISDECIAINEHLRLTPQTPQTSSRFPKTLFLATQCGIVIIFALYLYRRRYRISGN